VGPLLASFQAQTKAYPTWTDVDVSGAGLIVAADNFFISANDAGAQTFAADMVCDWPGAFPGRHFYSGDDISWLPTSEFDYSIECTVETALGVAPASLGRVKALFY